jgi:hypothetical protein
LLAVADNERASFAGLAVALGWISSKGENKAKVKRCADRLRADKLVKPDRRGTLALTEKGETEVKRLRANGPSKRETGDETVVHNLKLGSIVSPRLETI